MLNNIIIETASLLSIFIIYPVLDFKRFHNSIMWVAYLSTGGIIYHFILLKAGQICTPIKLPFMPYMGKTSRLFEEIGRPTSFFWEPASFSSFMMIPFFLTLYKKKYYLSALFMFAMLLSGSTNAIVLSAILLLVYIFTQNVKFKYKVMVLALGAGMFYFMFNSDMFASGVNKLENEDYENNVRIWNGYLITSNTDFSDLILGVPECNITDHVSKNNITQAITFVGEDVVYVTAIWTVLLAYGVVGLFLFIRFYFRITKDCRPLFPLVIVLIISSFVQSISPGTFTYTFQMIVLLSFYNNYLLQNNEKYLYANVS